MIEFNGEHILVVEDNLISFKLMAVHLQRAGLKVTHAETGKEALELFESIPFDLVLMDIQIPVVSGLDVTMKIREKNSSIPVIATTANAFHDDWQACIDAGCSDYFSKPIDFPVLLKTMKQLMDK